MSGSLIPLGYLASAALLIFGLQRLSKVRTARTGNRLAATGMLLAIVVTLIDVAAVDYRFILIGLILGSLVGAVAAIRVHMTEMPEMVALFNGFGGGASALVGLSVFFRGVPELTEGVTVSTMLGGPDVAISTVLSLLIGTLTLSGSLVAFLKLRGTMGDPVLLPGRHVLNILLLLAVIVAGVLVTATALGSGTAELVMLAVVVIALILGVTLVIPIGGADMPVVISLLNSYSGLAAAMTGFVLSNYLLIIAGSLVGAAGLILTQIMCKAMNRSLANVLVGGFGGEATTKGGKEGYTNITEASAEEMAMLLEDAESVVVVPGYGLAVAQAQHVTKELGSLLEGRGTTVQYAIHPVAGRMPGHMNVLLAEADVPYEQLVEMDDINPEFRTTDVTIVLGANDVVNPAALNEKTSPIYGMPILNVHESRSVFVIKRSLSPGYAGIPNELFDYDNTTMVFGDAKKVLTEVVSELKNA